MHGSRRVPSLSELQHSLAEALFRAADDTRSNASSWFRDADAARAGLRVHRNTVIGACWNALRMSYPTLERCLGGPLFEALAADFARSHPPIEPALSRYGEAFAHFAAEHVPEAARAMIRAMGVFDWLFERVAQCAPGFHGAVAVRLEGGARLQLAPSLRLHESAWPVDVLRECWLAGDAPAARSMPAEPIRVAVWRKAQGVALNRLSAPSFALLARLEAGASMDDALLAAAQPVAASEGAQGDSLAAILAQDVLQAGFTRIDIPESPP
jgi:hypothetical protein